MKGRNIGLPSFLRVVGEIISQLGIILNTFIYSVIPFLILTPETIARNLSFLPSKCLPELPTTHLPIAVWNLLKIGGRYGYYYVKTIGIR